MNIKSIQPDVLACKSSLCKVTPEIVEDLKIKASNSPRKRSRLCAHTKDTDRIHEMLIVLNKETYIVPHKHLNKTESLHVVEGEADVIIFDDNGLIQKRIPLAPYHLKKVFYYRLSKSLYHSLIVKSSYFVFCETTNGPFNSEGTIYAKWAPSEKSDPETINKYKASLGA
jgi:cupin fold WbuC family metalloprotein